MRIVNVATLRMSEMAQRLVGDGEQDDFIGEELSRWGGDGAVVALVIAIPNPRRRFRCGCGFRRIRRGLKLHLRQGSVLGAHGESTWGNESRVLSERNMVIGELLEELGKSCGSDRKSWVDLKGMNMHL